MTWLNILILFGAVQGLIFAMLLLFNKRHPGAIFLSGFVFVVAYNGFETFNWSSGLYLQFFEFFPFIWIFGLGPSLLFYVRSLLDPGNNISTSEVITHYAIVFFQLLVCLFVAGAYFLWTQGLVETTEPIAATFHIYRFYSEPLSALAFTAYLVASWKVFRGAQPPTGIVKEGRPVIKKWVGTLLTCGTILAVTWVLTIAAPYLLDLPYDVHYYPAEVMLVVFIYWLAFAGFRRTQQITVSASRDELNEKDGRETYEQLQKSMLDKKLYLDPRLSVSKVAAHTGIPPRKVSSVINYHGRQSFNEFVNTYRVQHVCRKLEDKEHDTLTLTGIALESGFNSQATFQRAFRLVMGMSPGQFLKKVEESTFKS